MNAKEMQIAFERKAQLMDPSLLADAKLDSDTIFAFLSAAQNRFVLTNYVTGDQYVMDTNAFAKNVDSIKNLIVEAELQAEGLSNSGAELYKLPNDANRDFFLYINSASKVTKTYLNYAGTKMEDTPMLIQNQLIKQIDIEKFSITPFNNPIIRNPGVVLVGSQFAPNASSLISGPSYIKLHHDSYTNVSSILLTYCRKPRPINTLSRANTLTQSELSENVHDEIVDMAVEMFITEAKYRLAAKSANNE